MSHMVLLIPRLKCEFRRPVTVEGLGKETHERSGTRISLFVGEIVRKTRRETRLQKEMG